AIERTLSDIERNPDAHKMIDLMPALLPCLSESLRYRLIDSAQNAALAIDYGKARDGTLRHLTVTLCDVGLPNMGFSVASLIDDTQIRSEALHVTSTSIARLLTPLDMREWQRGLKVLAAVHSKKSILRMKTAFIDCAEANFHFEVAICILLS